MTHLVHNEKLKLRATFLSNLGIASVHRLFRNAGIFRVRGNPDRAVRHGADRLDFLRRPSRSRHQQAERIARRRRLSPAAHTAPSELSTLDTADGDH
jgi:hypothetical protein